MAGFDRNGASPRRAPTTKGRRPGNRTGSPQAACSPSGRRDLTEWGEPAASPDDQGTPARKQNRQPAGCLFSIGAAGFEPATP